MRSYLALGEIDHVLFALAVAVASSLDGDPLWGLLVGAPSSGKTETLRMLDDVADEHLDEITVAGLLSWSKGRKPEKRGLLARRPGRVLATIADLSTMLTMSDRGSRDMLYSLLRRAYDGRVHRDIDGPEQLRWEGRLTLLAASTPSVDAYASHSDALGPRWLYLRLPPTDAQQRREASRKARDCGLALAEHRREVRELANKIVGDASSRLKNHATIGELLGDQLDNAALVACLGRANVPRDGYGRREIIGMPTIEEPPRIAGQLDKLARALLALTLDEKDTGALCRRAALDSIPQERLACLDALATGEPLNQSAVARHAACNRNVARRTLEELAAIDVATYIGADRDDDGQRGPWHLSGENAQLIQAVLAAPRGVPKSVKPTPIPQAQSVQTYFSGQGCSDSEQTSRRPAVVAEKSQLVSDTEGEVGPLSILHDHSRGISIVHERIDVLKALQEAEHGMTVAETALLLFATTSPDRKNDIEKARRRLNKLADSGRATRNDDPDGLARYFAQENRP
ncbi:MAG: hypothetical protein WKF41_16865 [Gaiellaceae bacterium]